MRVSGIRSALPATRPKRQTEVESEAVSGKRRREHPDEQWRYTVFTRARPDVRLETLAES